MAKKNNYSVTRVPTSDWDNIMETVTLDGGYSEEIKNEILSAVENMEDFSNPWVVINIKDGKANAKIFGKEESARKYFENVKRKSPTQQLFCVQGQYQSQLLNTWFFRELIRKAKKKGFFTKLDVDDLIGNVNTETGSKRYSNSTIGRRTTTIMAWIHWIAEELKSFIVENDKVVLK